MARVLVIAAHPDDETLGCGGTIARHVAEGDDAWLFVLSDGVGSRNADPGERMKALDQAAKTLGVSARICKSLTSGKPQLPDNEFDTVSLLEIVRVIERYRRYLMPDIVYTHSPADLNIDHRRTFEATLTACRPGLTSVKELYSYEVPSATEWGPGVFKPNLFVDITAHEATKLEALQAYHMELRPFPHPRSVEAIQARHRYWGSVAGVNAAEAFEVVRHVR